MGPDTGSERALRFAELCADQRSFREWYDRALPVVYGFVLARCAGDEPTARDVTQEAFLAAVRQRDRYRGDAEPTTWICGIARHKLLDHFRRIAREDKQRLRLLEGGGALGPPVTSVEDHSDLRHAVLAALQHLNEAQRAVLTLHYLEGMSMREIAHALDRSESAVESLLTRARESFRRAYHDGGDD